MLPQGTTPQQPNDQWRFLSPPSDDQATTPLDLREENSREHLLNISAQDPSRLVDALDEVRAAFPNGRVPFLKFV